MNSRKYVEEHIIILSYMSRANNINKIYYEIYRNYVYIYICISRLHQNRSNNRDSYEITFDKIKFMEISLFFCID